MKWWGCRKRILEHTSVQRLFRRPGSWVSHSHTHADTLNIERRGALLLQRVTKLEHFIEHPHGSCVHCKAMRNLEYPTLAPLTRCSESHTLSLSFCLAPSASTAAAAALASTAARPSRAEHSSAVIACTRFSHAC